MRYSGLSIVVIALLSIVGICMMAARLKPPINTIQSGDRDIVSLISYLKVLPAEQKKVQTASRQVDSILDFQDPKGDYSELISMPPEVAASQLVISTVVPDKEPRAPRHSYSAKMVFMAPHDRYAVVDGYFTREGDLLPDGGRVVSISQGKVNINDSGVVQTVVVPGSMPMVVPGGGKHDLR